MRFQRHEHHNNCIFRTCVKGGGVCPECTFLWLPTIAPGPPGLRFTGGSEQNIQIINELRRGGGLPMNIKI